MWSLAVTHLNINKTKAVLIILILLIVLCTFFFSTKHSVTHGGPPTGCFDKCSMVDIKLHCEDITIDDYVLREECEYLCIGTLSNNCW